MKKCLAICIYLLLITTLLRFDIRLLFDARQLSLVISGAALLYLPALGVKQKKFHFDRGLLGQNSLWASIIQTFVLLFVVLSEGQSRDEMMMQTAMACRPRLYGLCLWVILSGDSLDGHDEREARDREEKAEFTADTIVGVESSIGNRAEKKVQKQITGEAENAEGAEQFIDDNAEKEVQKGIYDEAKDTGGVEQFIDDSTEKEMQKQVYDEAEKMQETEETQEKIKEISKDTESNENRNTERKTPREHLASLGLTRREIEVALLAAANLSNAEIAAELFISETTVKKHLSNIYGKLGISKRGQIAELFRKS